MSEHIKVEESYVKALIENAAWDLDLPEFGSEIVEGIRRETRARISPEIRVISKQEPGRVTRARRATPMMRSSRR